MRIIVVSYELLTFLQQTRDIDSVLAQCRGFAGSKQLEMS